MLFVLVLSVQLPTQLGASGFLSRFWIQNSLAIFFIPMQQSYGKNTFEIKFTILLEHNFVACITREFTEKLPIRNRG
jgi:hypothetical protein